ESPEASESAEPSETPEASESAEPSEAPKAAEAVETASTEEKDTHGALVSTAARMPTPVGFANHGAFVSCVAHLDVSVIGFEWTTVTPEFCGAANPKAAEKAAKAAEKAAEKAAKAAGKSAEGKAKGATARAAHGKPSR
ncbi:MAG: hypothetical protein MUQ32_07505, partial [Chloroflexi bacterium]|nr:hypothetical protein [Chloroflexota bacterium]